MMENLTNTYCIPLQSLKTKENLLFLIKENRHRTKNDSKKRNLLMFFYHICHYQERLSPATFIVRRRIVKR